MKKGLSLIALLPMLLFSIEGLAQISKFEKGHGPQLPPSEALKDLNKSQHSKQLMTIADNIDSKIRTVSTIQQLDSTLETESSKLMNIKPTNKDAQHYINVLSMSLKKLASRKPEEIMAASMSLHQHLSELPMTLQGKNLMNLHSAALKLQKSFLNIANQKAALALKQAQAKTGKARDTAIIQGLSALPLHAADDEIITLRMKSLDLLKQLHDLKSPSADKDFMELQTKAMELQAAE